MLTSEVEGDHVSQSGIRLVYPYTYQFSFSLN